MRNRRDRCRSEVEGKDRDIENRTGMGRCIKDIWGERNGLRGEGDEGRFEAEREKRNQKERQRVRGSDGEAVPTEIES